MSDELVDQADPPMPKYRVIATPRDDGGYQLDFVDLGSTQTRETSRAAVEQAAREFLSLMLGLPGDRFRVKIEYRDS